jgi:hypothetical protein
VTELNRIIQLHEGVIGSLLRVKQCSLKELLILLNKLAVNVNYFKIE